MMKKLLFFIFSIIPYIGFGQAIIDTFTVNGVSFEMVRVEGGKFERGCTIKENDTCRKNEEGRHTVILKDFSIGKYEVTQELWVAVMGKNPSYFRRSNRLHSSISELSIQNPVDSINWYEAQTFIDSLNKITGEKFRLPTEAEWEYAARGGKYQEKYRYSGSNYFDLVAWCCENGCGWSRKTGLKRPNALGIYDMSGNIAEWCFDWFDENYYKTAKILNSPKGPATGTEKVLRGGNWGLPEVFARVTTRYARPPEYQNIGNGLRLAR